MKFINFQEFLTQIECRDKMHIRRDADCCNWYLNQTRLFHERANFPWCIFKEATFYYWSETTYTDKNLADLEAGKYAGATVVMHFYCDENEPAWFISFRELDHAAEHAYNQLLKQNYFI
jgi:hypothetical protein